MRPAERGHLGIHRGSRSGTNLTTCCSPSGVDSTGLSHRSSPTQPGQLTRRLAALDALDERLAAVLAPTWSCSAGPAAGAASRRRSKGPPWRPGPAECRSTTCAPSRRRRRGGRPRAASALAKCSTAALEALYDARPGAAAIGRQRRHDQHVAAPLDAPTAARRARCGTRPTTLTSISVRKPRGRPGAPTRTWRFRRWPSRCRCRRTDRSPAATAPSMAARSRTSATTVSTRSSPSAPASSASGASSRSVSTSLAPLRVQPAGHLGADAAGTTGDEDDLAVHRCPELIAATYSTAGRVYS